MKMFYVSLCSIFFAIVHVQSWKYGEIRSANDINREFIRKIVNVEEVENWAPIIKQTIIYNDIYKPALSLISKEDQLTKTINVLDLLQTYVKGEETKETVDINVIRDLITVCYECTCLKSLSLFALLASKDLKKYHETINNDEDKAIGVNQDENIDGTRCPEVLPHSLPYNILQMEKPFIAMIRKLAALNIKYDLPLEVFRVIYGQRADGVTDDNYLNGILFVLKETIKIADGLLTKKCVDHQGSLVKKYDVFLDDREGNEFKQFITALDQDSNMEYVPRFFEHFVVVAIKAIKETNSIALSDKLEVPTDLALLEKSSSMKITFDQDDLELVLDNSFGESSLEQEYLESRMLEDGLNDEFGIPSTDEDNSVDGDDDDLDAYVLRNMLDSSNYEEWASDYNENDNNVFGNEGWTKYVDHDETVNTFVNENDQVENFPGNKTVDTFNDVVVLKSEFNDDGQNKIEKNTFLNTYSQLEDFLGNIKFSENSQLEDFSGNNSVYRPLNNVEMLKSDDKDDETGITFLNQNSQLNDFLRNEINDRSNDVEVLKNGDSSHTAHNVT
ncbi:uncharacterized protein LOC126843173 [Adelges cooleyi]|uniref:uncharacterized protein LOC126843173 n=1 Tax=Adelges cooleyi TaxID=133065 RepID=UPI00217FD1B9|nr:uncharacterized protein LOC126843173 [Adelges cooleyi]